MKTGIAALALIALPLQAQDLGTQLIPMHSHGSHTYYIHSEIPGAGEYSMLVDTGSGYSVINEDTLAKLLEGGQAEYVSKLRGTMADGSQRIIPLYKIASITLGENCVIRDFKAAVLPGNTRQIIGITTLVQAAPFSMSFDPPSLTLSQCGTGSPVEQAKVVAPHAEALPTPGPGQKNNQIPPAEADET
ncbi:MAG: clan AA aspartic protease [Gammaproteobacteria bacterium]|nr:clan AA aspartic protease [Gammaproteobacteria bacterium]